MGRKKDFFKGLAIEELEKDNPEAWQEYPVFYFDFNKENYKRDTALEDVLAEHLSEWEKQYCIDGSNVPLEERFRKLIVKAYEETGKQVVVLVDEYDKPLLEVMTDGDLEEHNKAVFKGFFSTLKSYDQYLKFVFLTGVTKFSKVSIFSNLNQLKDISLSNDYSAICGITEEELLMTFSPEIDEMSKENDISRDECIDQLRRTYDGYHFSKSSVGVYNPFSLINAFSDRGFSAYWFSTGTTTFLLEKLKQINFDAKRFTGEDVYADEQSLTDYRGDNPDPIPLFYQTGYLTIKGYDKKFESYQLGYPNNEVKYGFIRSLAPMYLHQANNSPLDIRNFGRDIENANLDGLRDRFIELFARLPYSDDKKYVERDFQNVIYIVFMLLGQFIHTEIHTSRGRADCVVEADDYIYLFEFKRDKSADEAIKQIKDKGYMDAYAADKRQLIRIGVNFDSEKCTVDEWKVVR